MITPDWDVSAAKQLFRLADRGVVPKLPELHPAAWFIPKVDPVSIMARFEEWKETGFLTFIFRFLTRLFV